MVSKPKAPTPPDPVATANAQTSSNINTGIAQGYLNATDQITPYGTVKYNQTGYQNVGGNTIPTFESVTSLNPTYQAILDSQARTGQRALDTGDLLLQNVQGAISSPFNLSGLPPLQTGVDGGQIQTSLPVKDYSADRRRVEDAIMSRFNQDFARQDASNDVKLANQGIGLGSEAYAADKDILNRSRNDALTQAILAGGQEQSRLFGLDQASGQFANQAQAQQYGQNYQNASLQNQARQQAISELLQQRNQPLNELAVLLGYAPGIQTPNPPSFGGNVAGTDIAGITQGNFNNQMANYNTAMNQQSGLLGGLFGLGSAAILASDRRLKHDVRRIGTTDKGIPIYTFRYNSDGSSKHVGVMAQDVEKVMPWAVVEMDNGYKAVNYDMVG